MRILQVHNRHRTEGGADAVVDAEAAQLRSLGHEVDQWFGPSADELGLDPVRMAAAAVWNRSAVATLDRRVRQFRPDVVHVHTPFPLLSPAVLRVGHRAGCATVTTAHSFRYSCVAGTCLRDRAICEDCIGSRWKTPGVRHRCYHDSLPASLALTTSLALHRTIGTFSRSVDRFITLTDFARKILVRDGVDPELVVVKPNAVPDPGPALPLEGRRGYALFVGRLVEEKGVRTLLRAWAELDSPTPLLVAGDGPLMPEVTSAAATNPLIRALGWCDDDQLAELQAHARVTVVPSEWYEAGPPLVLLQALAAGTPVIASDLDNISSSLVQAGAGRTFATGSSQELARAVGLLLDDTADTWPSMSGMARSLYEQRHTPEQSGQALESVYRDALDRRAYVIQSPDARTRG